MPENTELPPISQQIQLAIETSIEKSKPALAFMAKMHSEAVDLLAGLCGQDLMRRCITPGGASIPVWKWLRAMVEHEAHHRGQIYMMLSMLGVATPPLYGLTEEEVRAASQE